MTKEERYRLYDVFTPTKPARLTFVERESLNVKLVNALETPGKQIIVYGHTGSGKTTLLVNKLQQLYENHITTRCVSNLTFEHLILNAFDQLSPYYEAEIQHQSTTESRSGVQAEYLGLKAEVGETLKAQSGISVKRALPPQLTPQTLARLLGHIHACWVLEDFHKIPPQEKMKLAQVMKVFMDMADEFSDVKIVAIGAVGTAREVVAYDPEMRNRVAEIEVPLMTHEELRRIPEIGEQLLNVRIPIHVKQGIVKYANGLASICHNLCLNICSAAGVVETLDKTLTLGEDELRTAVEQYLAEASDTLKAAFDRAFRRKKAGKYDNCRLIINALAHCSQEGATHAEIMDQIRQKEADYPAGNLTHYLRQLQTEDRGSVIRQDAGAGRYVFVDPIYHAFALASSRRGAPFQREIVIKFPKLHSTDFIKILTEHLVVRLTEVKTKAPHETRKTSEEGEP